jgi:hypothetical protein
MTEDLSVLDYIRCQGDRKKAFAMLFWKSADHQKDIALKAFEDTGQPSEIPPDIRGPLRQEVCRLAERFRRLRKCLWPGQRNPVTNEPKNLLFRSWNGLSTEETLKVAYGNQPLSQIPEQTKAYIKIGYEVYYDVLCVLVHPNPLSASFGAFRRSAGGANGRNADKQSVLMAYRLLRVLFLEMLCAYDLVGQPAAGRIPPWDEFNSWAEALYLSAGIERPWQVPPSAAT